MIADDTPLDLSDLSKLEDFLSNLRFDVTPEVIFKPRFVTPDTRQQAQQVNKETHGYMFYIDCLEGADPVLMLMKTKELRSSTVGFVADVPEGLLEAAVNREGVKDYCGMYPLDDAVIGWIKKELGITS